MRDICDELIEVVFEGIDRETTRSIVKYIMGKEADFLTEGSPIIDIYVGNIILNSENIISKSRMRIIFYNNLYDIEINFIPKDGVYMSLESMFDDIHKFSISIGENYNIKKYYSGIDPARDHETRIFTNKKRNWYFED